MRHADLLREATAVIATPASAPCLILQFGTWYGCVAVWPCGCVFGGGMSDAIGSKNTCKTFSTEFLDWIQWKKSSFSTGSTSRSSQSKKVESKKPFSALRKKKPDLGFSRKRPFSTDKPDCIRNGLRSQTGGAGYYTLTKKVVKKRHFLDSYRKSQRSVFFVVLTFLGVWLSVSSPLLRVS